MRRPAAVELEIQAIAEFIARDNENAAFRFLDAVESVFDDLAFFPKMGGPLEIVDHPKLANVRVTMVPGFPNHLVVYRLREDSITVLRVAHARRNLLALLGIE